MGLAPVRRRHLASAICMAGLAGIAYCHIKDVGMKFDEHVYYMAALFCCNIVASLGLIPLVARQGHSPSDRGPLVWASAICLAVATIAGFVWSRTIGFPQMADHVGEWDALGPELRGVRARRRRRGRLELGYLARRRPATAVATPASSPEVGDDALPTTGSSLCALASLRPP